MVSATPAKKAAAKRAPAKKAGGPAKKATARPRAAQPVPVGETPAELQDFYAPIPEPAPAPAPVIRDARPQEVPEELRNFYATVDGIEADTADVSLDMVSKTDAERARDAPREKLFSIDGVEHTIPVEFGPNLALTFIDLISRPEVGEDIALGRVLRAAMGETSWRALVGFQDLTPAQLKKILGITMRKIMGAVEREKGK